MRTPSPTVTSLLKEGGWSFLFYGMVALCSVGQIASAVSMPADQAWRMAARDWLPWAVATPLLWRVVSRFPLERRSWRMTLPVHLLCVTVALGTFTLWGQVVPPRSARAQQKLHSTNLPPERNRLSFPFLFFQLMIYLAVVGVGHALCFYRRSLAQSYRLNQAQLQAQLAALKMQLQPHFLFNSLNAVTALIHLDPDAADEMIVALSDLLRLSLETSGDQLLPLSKEAEFVRRYLAIQHIRFGDRLLFEVEVATDTQAALVPAFVLQPLVENAVRHGLEPRSGRGRLKVSSRRAGQDLCLCIQDDGVGVSGTAPLREGIGLSNTRERLSVLYGKAARLEFAADKGMTVYVHLPFHTTSPLE